MAFKLVEGQRGRVEFQLRKTAQRLIKHTVFASKFHLPPRFNIEMFVG